MRPVLFRGQDEDGCWHEGYYVVLGDGTDIERHVIMQSTLNSNYFIETHSFTEFNVNPKTVGQFTGLYDKIGKMIFEGDILTFDEIKWRNKPIIFDVKLEDNGENGIGWTKFSPRNQVKIIGNIHDNPELLNN